MSGNFLEAHGRLASSCEAAIDVSHAKGAVLSGEQSRYMDVLAGIGEATRYIQDVKVKYKKSDLWGRWESHPVARQQKNLVEATILLLIHERLNKLCLKCNGIGHEWLGSKKISCPVCLGDGYLVQSQIEIQQTRCRHLGITVPEYLRWRPSILQIQDFLAHTEDEAENLGRQFLWGGNFHFLTAPRSRGAAIPPINEGDGHINQTLRGQIDSLKYVGPRVRGKPNPAYI